MTLAALSLSSAVFAQKPVAGNVTGEVQLNFQTGTAPINIDAPTLNFRYFFTNDIAGRLKFVLESNKHKIDSLEDKFSSMTFAPGIEKHFGGTDKLSPYVGAELAIGSGKNEHKEDTLPTVTDKFSSFGFNLIFGADYYIWPSVYVGAEVGWGFYSETTKPDQGPDIKDSGFDLSTNSGVRLGIKF